MTVIVMCTLAECNNCECSLSVLPFIVLTEDVEEDHSCGDQSCMNKTSQLHYLSLFCIF